MGIVRTLALFLLLSSSEAFSERKHSPSTHVYKTVDGLNILIDVLTPDHGGKHPAIIYIHAGGLIQGSREWVRPWQRQMYVDAGFVFASVDHRLAPESKLDEIHSDIEDAYNWLRTEGPERFDIDANRIAVVGHSAGGYLALSSGFRFTPRPRAIISFYGYGDVTGAWYTEPNADFIEDEPISEKIARQSVGKVAISGTPLDMEHNRGVFYAWTRQQGNWPNQVGGRDPLVERDWFKGYEPVYNVSRDYPPTLLLHGERDGDVPYEQSTLMIEAFQKNDVPYELISNPEWNHMFDGPENTPDLQVVFSKVIKFLVTHTR